MNIARLEAVHVRVPLTTPYVISRGTMTAFDTVMVRLVADDGTVGYGESVPLSVVGDAARFASTLNGPVAEQVRGRDAADIGPVLDGARTIVGDEVDVLGGLDSALWDLQGRALGVPVHRLLGGLYQELIPVDFTISADEPDRMAARAEEMVTGGFRGVVVKVTCEDVQEDIARVRAVRGRLPDAATVRVDCNGGYSRDEAITFLRGVDGIGVEFVEQPVAGDDLEGMAACCRVGVPISADESLNTVQDALALVRADAADVFNIKVPKVGGLLFARRIAAVADAAGRPVVVGGRTTLEPSRHASRHFAAATLGAGDRAHEGPGPASQELSDTVLTTTTSRATVADTNGCVPVETTPGLGMEVRWDVVERYAVRG